MISLLLHFSNTFAGTCQDVRKAGYEVLPEFCKVRCEKTQPDYARWDKTLGHYTFMHTHHYCFGLAYDYLGNYHRAIKEYDYVIRLFPKDSPLLPRALYKKATIMEKQGKHPEAVALFRRATEVKPDFTPPYAALSDWAKSIGDNKRAISYLKDGLVISPNSRLLNDRLNELRKQSP